MLDICTHCVCLKHVLTEIFRIIDTLFFLIPKIEVCLGVPHKYQLRHLISTHASYATG